MDRIKLKGEYRIIVTYTTMFHQYQATIQQSNLITDKGLEFLIQKWGQDNTQTNVGEILKHKISKIIVGYNPTDPTPDDNISTITRNNDQNNPFPVNLKHEGNQLIMVNNNVNGKTINQTTEIGVIGEKIIENYNTYTNEVDNVEVYETVLISRSTHPIITVPPTSIISLEYKYTLTSVQSEDEC